MDRIRTLIVDDEPPARAKVRRLLGVHPSVDVVGEAKDGDEALDRIRDLKPDLVILDIQMPGRTGFEVLAALKADEIPHVVFATAFDEHAIRAFDVAAVDYLLKPFDRKRLARAIDRVRQRMAAGASHEARLEEVVDLLHAASARYLERVVVDSRGRRLVVDVNDIRRLESDGNYVSIHAAGKSYLCRGTLASYEARLDPNRFIRVHRSNLVNAARVAEIRSVARGDQMLVMDDGSEVRVSRNYRDRISRIFEL